MQKPSEKELLTLLLERKGKFVDTGTNRSDLIISLGARGDEIDSLVKAMKAEGSLDFYQDFLLPEDYYVKITKKGVEKLKELQK